MSCTHLYRKKSCKDVSRREGCLPKDPVYDSSYHCVCSNLVETYHIGDILVHYIAGLLALIVSSISEKYWGSM